MQPFEIQQPEQGGTRGRPGRPQKQNAAPVLQYGIALVISGTVIVIIIVVYSTLRSKQDGPAEEDIPEFNKVVDVYAFVRNLEKNCLKGGSRFKDLHSEISDEIHSLEVSAFMFVSVVVDQKRPIGVRSTGGRHAFQDNILEFVGRQANRPCAEVVLHKPLQSLRVSASARVKIHGGVAAGVTVTSGGIAYVDQFLGTSGNDFVSVNSQGTCAVGLVPEDGKLLGNINIETSTNLLVGENLGEITRMHGGDLLIEKGQQAVSKISQAGETIISEKEQLQTQRKIKTVDAAKQYFDRLFGQCPEDGFISHDGVIPEDSVVQGVVLSDFMLMKVTVDEEADIGLRSNGGTVHFLEGENTVEFTGVSSRLFCAEVNLHEPLLRVTASAGSKIRVEGGLVHSATVSSNAIAFIESFTGSSDSDHVNVNTQGVVVIETVPEGHKLLASVARAAGTRLVVGTNQGVISKDEEGSIFVESGPGTVARLAESEPAVS